MPKAPAPPATKKEKRPVYLERFNILIFALLVLILLPGFLFFVKPEFDSFRQNKTDFKAREQQREIKISSLLKYKKTLSSYQSVNEIHQDKINTILPPTVEEANLYLNIDGLAKEADVIIESISINPVSIEKKIKPILGKGEAIDPLEALSADVGLVDIALGFSNVNYVKLKKIFSLMEENIRLLDIDDFSFDPEMGNLDINITTYYYSSVTKKN
jgi:hypothetical protein